MPRFLHIRTSKFPILEGGEEEIINPGTYGKAFAEYIESVLVSHGFTVPFVVCEDWGWWVELALPEKSIGITCYREHESNTDCGFCCAPSVENAKAWSWKRFRFVNIGKDLEAVESVLTTAFSTDPEIRFFGEHHGEPDDWPGSLSGTRPDFP